MPVSVVVVDEAFFNDKRLQHTGVIFCHTVGGIPTVGLLGYNGDGQTFEFPQDGEFKTPELETGQFFINQELRIFGLIYDDKGEVKIFTAFLAPPLLHYDDEIRTLHRFTKTLLYQKPIAVTKTSDELNKFFASLGPSSHKAFRDQFAAKMAAAGSKQKHAIAISRITSDQFYYQAYVNFVEKHPLNSKDATQLIRGLDNFPKFAIETLEFAFAQNIYQLAANFLRNHLCGNRECGGFSFIKCSRCNTLHYCNRDCQLKDFPRHKTQCSLIDEITKSKKIVSTKLHGILSSSQTGSDTNLIEMDVFVREIMLKAYSLFHEAFTRGADKCVHARLIYLFMAHVRQDVRIEQIQWKKMDQLLGKGKKAEKFNKVLRHLKKAHGVANAKFQKDYVESFEKMVDVPGTFEETIERVAKGMQFAVSMKQESNPEKKAFMEKLDKKMANEVKKIHDIKL